MKFDNPIIAKYLDRYADPSIQALEIDCEEEFDSVLVIPVYDEPLAPLVDIIHKVRGRSAMLILVFNAPDIDGSEDEVKTAAQVRTQQTRDSILEMTNARLKVGYYEAALSPTASLYVLDYCQSDKLLPKKQGVGLARKLGMDLGLKLAQAQYERCAKEVACLHSSDADVCLPETYFDITIDGDFSALVYPFQHLAEEGFELATRMYEHSLRYYVDQLARAGSPYAFHTIGSLIAVCPVAYAMVRGFPRRSAGEDFYLLNKFAKVGQVRSLKQPLVQLSGRPSRRVPFGTGPALLKINDLVDPRNAYTYYNPKSFELLKSLLDIISSTGQSFSSAELLFEAIRAKMTVVESSALIQALVNLKIEKQFEHLSKKGELDSFRRAFHTWFDAFVTLRFIHELRDSVYPNVPLHELPRLSN